MKFIKFLWCYATEWKEPLIVIVALISVSFIGYYQVGSRIEEIKNASVEVLEIDDCEYILYNRTYARNGTLAHKGNCRFCEARRLSGHSVELYEVIGNNVPVYDKVPEEYR